MVNSMNSSKTFIGLPEEENLTYDNVDINDKYHLNVIVPFVWSFIIVFGILGKNKLTLAI